jgi:hypothetical protein
MKKRPAKKATPSRHRDTPNLMSTGLTAQQHAFCLAYLENGFNATRAYMTAHLTVSRDVAGVEGFRDLRKPKIRAFLGRQLEDAWRPLQMGSEQALARVALLASDAPDDRVKLQALRTILEQTGKLKTLPSSIDGLTAALKADYEAHKNA